ncbi:MAG: 4'-phosphopantetheinyl transferase family protein [Gammaproteobacteria bacterium]
MSAAPDTPINGLFPNNVATCFSPVMPADAELLPAEQTDTEGMIEKRLQEFTHGRYSARQALRQLGTEAFAIPKAVDRSPVWPAGIVGTITHSGPLAAAAVARASDYAGLGLDLETNEPLTRDIRRMVCRNDEDPKDLAAAKLYFVCKEAIYKCIYPQVGVYVDFLEMELKLNHGDCSFTAVAHSENFDTRLVRPLQGQFRLAQGLIIAAAWIAT